jgi:autotransporter translocation and assembly factor TamB
MANLNGPSLQGATGEASVSQFDLLVRDTEVHQAEPVRISLKNDTITIDSFHIEGADTKADARGNIGVQSGVLNLDVKADTNLRILEAFIQDSNVTGRMQADAELRGSVRSPDIRGFIQIADTQFQIPEPPVDLVKLNARVELLGDRLEIQSADASLNGGKFTATGYSVYNSAGLSDSTLTLHAEKVQLEYPEGLQSEIDSELSLSRTGGYTSLEGNVAVVSALYRDDIDVSQQIFSGITKSSDRMNTAAPGLPAFTNQIALDVTVETSGLVTISNNVADLDISGNFRVRGDLSNPIVIGRAEVNEGGELYFGPGIARDEAAPLERRDRYAINRGIIEFNNPIRTEP